MAIRMPEKDARRLQGAQRWQGRSIFDEEESDQDAPGSVFDVEDTELGKAPTGELDVVPGKQQDLPQAAKDAMMRGGGTLGAVTPDRQPTNQANQPGDEGDGDAPQEPQGMFDDLEDIDTRQERERQAFADELEARRAEAMQQAEARAGLGGMGLSGATAELTADIGRQEARAGDIAMADLSRRQQQETFDELRRQASIWAFEEEFDVDLDGDGNYGAQSDQPGQEPGNDQAGASQPQSTGQGIFEPVDGALPDIIAEFTGRGDVDLVEAPGHYNNPIPAQQASDVPQPSSQIGTDEQGNIVYLGADGAYYTAPPSNEGYRVWGE